MTVRGTSEAAFKQIHVNLKAAIVGDWKSLVNLLIWQVQR